MTRARNPGAGQRREFVKANRTEATHRIANVKIEQATEKAFLLVIAGEEVWMPRSQIRSLEPQEVGESGELVITEWIAKQKGLL